MGSGMKWPGCEAYKGYICIWVMLQNVQYKKQTLSSQLVTRQITYVETVLAWMSQIFAVLSAEALRRNLLSALHDN